MRTNRNYRVELAVLGVLGALVVFSLVMPQLLRERSVPQLLSLSVLLRDTDSSGWNVARQGMEQAADELGAELRFLTLSEQNSSAEQAEQLLREMDNGAEALLVVPADPDVLHTSLLQRTKTCPIVTLESEMEGTVGTVAPDSALLGRQLAQTLLDDWQGGEVLLLDSAPGCTGVTARLAAAQKVLEAQGVPVQRAEGLPEEAGWVGWVIAFDPVATQAAAERRESEQLPFVLYGVGSSTAIAAQMEKGNIAAVAAWSDYAAGYLAVRQAVEAAQREELQSLDPLAFSIVQGEDIYAPENQKLLFPIMSSSGR